MNSAVGFLILLVLAAIIVLVSLCPFVRLSGWARVAGFTVGVVFLATLEHTVIPLF